MATRKVSVELEAKADKAISEVEDLKKELKGLKSSVEDFGKQGQKSLDDIGKEAKKTNKIFSGIKNLFKGALGLGIIIKAFELLKDTFENNQVVLDAFKTGTEALSIAFNDLFGFLSDNVGTVIEYFKSIFNDPQQALKDLGVAIKKNIIERINSSIEVLGYLGTAIKKVFQGDWDGAMEAAKSAGKEYVDVLTGVDGSLDKIKETVSNATDAVVSYATSTIKSAKAIVELNKAAELANVINQGLIEKYDRQAEQQRQIRDDETKTIAERIAANNKLGEILEEQQKLMLDNVDITIKAAQAEYDKNKNQENYIALLEAQNEREAVLAQIEGFRSEQLNNKIGLEKELIDLKKEADEAEKDRLEAADEAQKKRDEEAADRAEKIIEAKKREREEIYKNLDAVIDAAGQESAIGKALFLAKEAMRIKEMIEEAKATLQKIALSAAEAQVAVATGAANTAAAGLPTNIPLLIAFAAQAAGIIMAVKSAVGAAKGAAGAAGGGGGGGSVASAPAAPVFNVVGAAPENQLAQAIGEKENKPQRAYVVASDVSSQQSLDRNIIESASI